MRRWANILKRGRQEDLDKARLKNDLLNLWTTIRNGLPVIASGRVCRAEPDVGIMSQFVEDLEVVFLSGHPVPGELSDEDDQRIVQ